MNKKQCIRTNEFSISFLRKGLLVLAIGCYGFSSTAQEVSTNKKTPAQQRRFFSNTSFWNQPIPKNPEIDPQNDHFIKLLKREYSGAFFRINLTSWTIPVYDVDETTPRFVVKKYSILPAFCSVRNFRTKFKQLLEKCRINYPKLHYATNSK